MRRAFVTAAVLAFALVSTAARGDSSNAEATETAPPLPSRWTLWAEWNALNGDPYELDAVPRRLEDPRARVACACPAPISSGGCAPVPATRNAPATVGGPRAARGKRRELKIYLIAPKNPESFWTFDRALPSLRKR